MNVSILSERRVFAPYGLFGGEPGMKGLNIVVRENGKKYISLSSKNNIDVDAGDSFIIMTPGGGGFGKYEERDASKRKYKYFNNEDFIGSGDF